MRHDRSTEQEQELAALYALGSLTQHEARAFESHLKDDCEVCENEIEQFERVIGALGSGSPAATPPAYLRSVLEARIEKEARSPSNHSTEAALVIPFPEKPKSKSPSADLPRSTWVRTFIPWAIAASLLIALAYSIASWQSERKAHQASLAQVQREASRADETAQINSVLASSQHSRIAMQGLNSAPTSSGTIYWDIKGRRWVVTADLPPAPSGKVYQLWFVTPDAKVNAGLIQPDDRGHGFAVVNIPPTVEKIEAAAITLEPQGGSDQPTMPIYVLGQPG